MKKANALTIAGFVLSLVSLLISFWGIVPIASLMMCIFGRVKGEQQGEPTGMAIAGIVISIIGIVYSAIVLVLGMFI